MAWSRFNIENPLVNMSKVVPYDTDLSMFDKKQAYFHNNRLTALKRYQSDFPAGFKCFLRKAGTRYNTSNEQIQSSGYTIDGELTDYVEINTVNADTGVISHLMDVSAYYYKSDSASDLTKTEPDIFMSGIVLDNGCYIGSSSSWSAFNFYKLSTRCYVAYGTVSHEIKVLDTVPNSKKADVSVNYSVVYSGNSDSDILLAGNNSSYFFAVSKTDLQTILDETCGSEDSGWYSTRYTSNTTWEQIEHFSRTLLGNATEVPAYRIYSSSSSTTCTSTKLRGYISPNGSGPTVSVGGKSPHDVQSSDAYIRLYESGTSFRIINITRLYVALAHSSLSSSSKGWFGTYAQDTAVVMGDTVSTTADSDSGESQSASSPEVRLQESFSASFSNTFSDESFEIICTYSEFIKLGADNEDLHARYSSASIDKTVTKTYSIIATTSINRVNDSVFTNYKDFVVNYTNRLPVSIGHRYKTICRLDGTESYYCGSDSTGVYVTYKKTAYKITIEKMFPDNAYNDEVNIIENNTFCNDFGGYLVFNTTSYFNTCYGFSQEHILCSCDDWNGRYYTTSDSDPIYKSTSRVGHRWNIDTANQPCIISDELSENMEFLEYADPTYHWANSDYTIHKPVEDYMVHTGTAAIIYRQNSTQYDTMYEYMRAYNGTFDKNVTTTNSFVHNDGLQVVPSILFSNYFDAETHYYVTIATDTYELLYYTALGAPALVVDSEDPLSTSISTTDQGFVVQGAFYEIKGAGTNRRIHNYYDTSSNSYICDVTGLDYIGYDSKQAYFYSPATGVIYTFNGANKLNPYLSVDKRTPLKAVNTSDGSIGISVCNIPSMNIVAMGFTDGVLIIVNEQSIFVQAQGLSALNADRIHGLIRINSNYYYFGTNSSIIQAEATDADFNLKSCKVGIDRLTNQTISKHRLCIYSDSSSDAKVTVTITSRLENTIFTETFEKVIHQKDFVDNEFQWEISPKYTKSNWMQFELSMKNADLLDYYIDRSETSEENLIR